MFGYRRASSDNLVINASSNTKLLDILQAKGVLSSHSVLSAMRQVDRRHFCSSNTKPYEDDSQWIGYSVTISAPHMHARSLELLSNHLAEGNRCLDVGSGSGYLSVCMALMVGASGRAVGIDHIPELVDQATTNVSKAHRELLTSGRLKLVVGDGRKGYPQDAPYDAINVGAAATETPKELLEQLSPGGRLIIPVGTLEQKLWQYDKLQDGTVDARPVAQVDFVPLTSRESQWPAEHGDD